MYELRRLFVVVALLAGTCAPATRLIAQDEDPEIEPAPADVFVGIVQLSEEIEQLRREMGKPVSAFEFEIRNAAPREVYFQALTLFRKADRLAFEHLHERVNVPAQPQGPLRPKDVLAVVEAAGERIRDVKGKLKVDEAADAPVRDPTKTPTDVFRAIVKANQQLNVLLDHPFSPSDVFQQVQRASGLATALASPFSKTDFPREIPEFDRGKRPPDVYRQLFKCLKRVQKIFDASDLKVLEFEVSEITIDKATPSDVYDLASVLVAELAYLHELHPGAESPPAVFFPGRKFPSHVHQAARLLDQQLNWLQQQVSEQPDWLQREAP